MANSILGEVLGAFCCCWTTPAPGREGTSRDLKRLSDWRGHPTLRQYDLEKHIADGGFSEIWLARHRAAGAAACLKVVNLRKPGLRPEDAEVLRGEARYLRHLEHPSLLRCTDVFETKYHMVMILEYLTGGEMLDHLHRVEHYSEAEAGRLFAQVMSAVAYMHNLNIVHRDIKPENVMFARPVDDCAAAGKPLRVKLIDLGMAAVLPSEAPGAHDEHAGGSSQSLQHRKAASKAKAGSKNKVPGQSRIVPLTGVLGSPGFIAPEVVRGAQHSFAMDVYSLGVMLFIMLTGRKPWGLREVKTLEYARHSLAKAPGLQDASFRTLSAEAKDLLLKMLADDPKARPSAAAVMRHPFITRALAAAAKAGGQRGGEELQPRLDEVVKRRMLQLASLRRFRGLAFAMMSSPQEGQQLSEFMKGVAERRKALHRDLVSRAKTRRAVDKQRASQELQLQEQQQQLELQKQRSQRLQDAAAAAAGRAPAPSAGAGPAHPASRQHSIDSTGSQQPLLNRLKVASSSGVGPAGGPGGAQRGSAAAPRFISSSGVPPSDAHHAGSPAGDSNSGGCAMMLRVRRTSLESSRLSVDSRGGSGSLRPLLRSFEVVGPAGGSAHPQHDALQQRLPSHHPSHPIMPYGAPPAPAAGAHAAGELLALASPATPGAPWGSPSAVYSPSTHRLAPQPQPLPPYVAHHAHPAFPHHVLEPVAEPGEPASGTESTMTAPPSTAAATVSSVTAPAAVTTTAGSFAAGATGGGPAVAGHGAAAQAAVGDRRHAPVGGLTAALAAGGHTAARPPLPPHAPPHPHAQPQPRPQPATAQPDTGATGQHAAARQGVAYPQENKPLPAAHGGGGATGKGRGEGATAHSQAKRNERNGGGGMGRKGGSELELVALDPLALIRELPPAPGNGGAAARNSAGGAGRVTGVILGRSHSAPESSVAAAASAAVLEGLGAAGRGGVGAAGGGWAIPGAAAAGSAVDGVTAWLEQLALGADMRAFSANSWTLDLLANEELLAALTGVDLKGRLASSSLGDGAAGASVHDGTVYSSTLYGGYGSGGVAGTGAGGGGPAAAASTNLGELAGMLGSGSGDMMGSGGLAAGSVEAAPAAGTAAATRAASGAQAARAGSGSSAGPAEAGAAAPSTAAAASAAGSTGAAASARAVAAAAALRRLYSGIAAAGRTGSAGLDTTVHAASQAAALLAAAAQAAAANAAASPSSMVPTTAAYAPARAFSRRISEASSSGPASAGSGSLALPGMLSDGAAAGSRRGSIGSQPPAAGSFPRGAAALAASLASRALGSGAGGGGGPAPARLRPSRMSFDAVRTAQFSPGAMHAGGRLGAAAIGGDGGGRMSVDGSGTPNVGQGHGAAAASANWLPAARGARPSWAGASPVSYGSGGTPSPFTTGHGHRHSFSNMSQLQHGAGMFGVSGLARQVDGEAAVAVGAAEALGAGWSPSVAAATLQQQRSRLLSGTGSGRLLAEGSEVMSTVRDGDGYLNVTLQRAPSFGTAWRQSGAAGLPDNLLGLGSIAADTLAYGSVGMESGAATATAAATAAAGSAGVPALLNADGAPARMEPLPLLNTKRLILREEEHTEPNSPAATAPWGAPRGAPGRRRRGVAASPAAAMAAITTAAATIAATPATDGMLPKVESSNHAPAMLSSSVLYPAPSGSGTGLGNASSSEARGAAGGTGTTATATATTVRAAAVPITVPFTSSQWRRASLEAAAHTTRRISTEYSVSPATSMAPTPPADAALLAFRSPRPSRDADADVSVRLGGNAPTTLRGGMLLEGTEEEEEGEREGPESYLGAGGYAAMNRYPKQDSEDPMLTFSPASYFTPGSLAAVTELDDQSPLPLRAFLAPRPSLSLALPHADEVIAAERAALEETLHGGNMWMMDVVGGRRAVPAGSVAAVAAAAAAARSSQLSGGLSGGVSGGLDRSTAAPAGAVRAGAVDSGTVLASTAADGAVNGGYGTAAPGHEAVRQDTQSRPHPHSHASTPPDAAASDLLDLPRTWPATSISPAAVLAVRAAAPASRPLPIPAAHKHSAGHSHGTVASAMHNRQAATEHVRDAAADNVHHTGLPLHAAPTAAAAAAPPPPVNSPRGVGTHHMLLDGGSIGGAAAFGSYGSAAVTAPDSPRTAVPHSVRSHQHSPMRAARRRPAAVATASSGEQHGDSSAHGGSRHGGGDSSAHGGAAQEGGGGGALPAGETLTAPRRGPHVSDSFYAVVNRPRPVGNEQQSSGAASLAPQPQPHLSPPEMHRWHSPFEAAAKQPLPEWDGTIASAAAGRQGGAPPQAAAAHAVAAAAGAARQAAAAPPPWHGAHGRGGGGHGQRADAGKAGHVCGSPTRWHSPFEAYAAAPMPAASSTDELLRRPQRRD